MKDPMSFFSNLNLRMSVEDFMKRLLKIALSIFPQFHMGSVVLKRKGRWEYVAWVGFPDLIAEIKLEEGKFFVPKSEDPFVVNEILKAGERFLDEETKKLYEKIGSGKIVKTVCAPLKNEDGEIIGAIFLDSTKDVRISKKVLESIKAFSKIASIFTSMKLYQEKERGYQRSIILAMIKAMEVRDPYTVGHSERVAKYAVNLAKKIGLDMEIVDRIFWGSLVHDIGKLSVPERILLKPEDLTPDEYEIVKKHTVVGEDMLKDYSWLESIRSIVRNHHERWDGRGYPDGLKGEKIPLEVRIVSIADAFDAMTSDRAYRKALSIEMALSEIEKSKEKQFDPELASIFIDMMD